MGLSRKTYFPSVQQIVRERGVFRRSKKDELKVERTIIDHFLSALSEKASLTPHHTSAPLIFSFKFNWLLRYTFWYINCLDM